MYNTGDFTELKQNIDTDSEWEDRISLLDTLSSKYIASVEADIIKYYASLEQRDRFWNDLGSAIERTSPKESMWEAWNYNNRLADRIHPREKAIYIKKLLDKAGNGSVLRWFETISCDWEMIAIITYASDKNNRIELLKEVCTSTYSERTRTILLFCLISDRNIDFNDLYKIISEHKDKLRIPILDMLCDFYLPCTNKHLSESITKLFDLYTEQQSINYISPKKQRKGMLFAWSHFLSELDAKQSDDLEKFRKAYFSWLETEKTYSFSEQSGKEIIEEEFGFINQLSSIIGSDDATCNHLLNLWRRKSECYYGWTSQTTTEYSQWFLHLGLLLWCIGWNRYNDNKDQTMLLTVAGFLNEYIISALSPSSYRQLVTQVFQYDYDPVKELEDCMCELIAKIYELETLLVIESVYLKTKFKRTSILKMLLQKIKTVYEFQKTSPVSKEKIDLVTGTIEDAIVVLQSN